MATVTERLRLVIDASAKGVASEIRGVGEESEKASIKTRLLTSASDKLGVSVDETGRLLKTGLAVGAGAALGGLVALGVSGVSAVTDLTDEIRDFQRVSGASAEDSSRWVAALDDMEISSEAGARAVFKLSREIGEGGTKLAQFGVEIAKNKDGTTNLSETLLNVADAYNATSDKGQQAALIQEAFGRAGKELIPVLEQGRKGIKDLFEGAEEGHQIFSQEDLQNAREFELAMDDLQDTLRGFQIEAGKAIIPVASQFANLSSETLEATDKISSSLGGISGVVNTAFDASPIGNFNLAVGGLGDILDGNFSEGVGKAGLSLVPFGGAINDLTGLFDDGGDAAEDFASKQQAVKDATTNVANAISEHGKNSKEARDAERELASASRDLKGDQDDVAGSLQSVNDKLQTHADKAYAAAAADLQLGANKLSLERSTTAVSEAFDKFNTTAVANIAAGDTSAEATRNLESAHQGLVGAVLQTIAAARDKAIADTEGKSKAEQQEAATNAQKYALLLLEQQFPGLREQVQGYVGDLDKIPPSINTNITTTGIGAALNDAQILQNYLNAIDGRSVTIYVDMVERTVGKISPF